VDSKIKKESKEEERLHDSRVPRKRRSGKRKEKNSLSLTRPIVAGRRRSSRKGKWRVCRKMTLCFPEDFGMEERRTYQPGRGEKMVEGIELRAKGVISSREKRAPSLNGIRSSKDEGWGGLE